MLLNNTVDSVANFMLTCAEEDIRLLRRAYETVKNPRWQQVQKLKVQVFKEEVKGAVSTAKDSLQVVAAQLQVVSLDAERATSVLKAKARMVAQAIRPRWLKAVEGCAIALGWLAVGERFVADCWQAYVDWADRFVCDRLEPEFEVDVVEIKLLTTPLENENQLLCESQTGDARSDINQSLSAEVASGVRFALPQVSAVQGFAERLQALGGRCRNVAEALHSRVFRPTV